MYFDKDELSLKSIAIILNKTTIYLSFLCLRRKKL